jgi:succinoglycan biosynthesis transport protein ExoP
VIPFTRQPDGADGDDPAELEPFRVLHTNLNLTLPAGPAQSLVIFSAGPGEGKSTTLHRLARLMAASGERILLVDSDLRRPTQHRLAGGAREPGLSELLRGQRPLEEVLQRNLAPNLDFIPSGGVAGFTLSLVYGHRLRELIAGWKERYDKIVFDSPPIIGVSDASVLMNVVDAAVLLIQHRRNPQSMVLRARQIVEDRKTALVGVVLNQVPVNEGGDYGYYTSNYAYYGDGTRSRHRRAPGPAPSAQVPGERLDLREPAGAVPGRRVRPDRAGGAPDRRSSWPATGH